MTDFQLEIDTRNEKCPQPVKKTKQALKDMGQGEILHIMTTDPASEEDIQVLLGAVKDELLDTRFENGVYHFYIKKL